MNKKEFKNPYYLFISSFCYCKIKLMFEILNNCCVKHLRNVLHLNWLVWNIYQYFFCCFSSPPLYSSALRYNSQTNLTVQQISMVRKEFQVSPDSYICLFCNLLVPYKAGTIPYHPSKEKTMAVRTPAKEYCGSQPFPIIGTSRQRR